MRQYHDTQLLDDFRLVLSTGDIIMVHSSLSKIGHVTSGANTVIKCLKQIITESGTLLMPSYGSAKDVQQKYQCGQVIDMRVAESKVGAITETFRKSPDVYQSSHPFSSVCAWGNQAEYFISGHADDPRICHLESPIGRLWQMNGKYVGLGVSVYVIAIYHLLEDTWKDYPYHLYSEPYILKYIDPLGNDVKRQVCSYDNTRIINRIDQPGSSWLRDTMTYHLTRKGLLKQFYFGNAKSWIIETVPLYNELKRLAQKNITIYLSKEEWDKRNESIDSW